MSAEGKRIIVVAGGTGGIGRHIVDGIVNTKKFIVKVFSRQDPSTLRDLTEKGVIVVQVDYSNHELLVKELQGVHTVIVTLISLDESSIYSQINLLNASLEAKVKRFAPSEWAGKHEETSPIELYKFLKLPVREKVKASGIEYTIFVNGIFMDYFASPQRASASLPPLTVGVDFNTCQADLFGTGNEPFCITRADDVGKFVAAALDLDKWDEYTGMIGSRITWNELIKLGEKIRGKQFHVKYSSLDEVVQLAKDTNDNIMKKFMYQVHVSLIQGEFDYEDTLNKKCSQVQPTTIENFLLQWWDDKQGQVL
ncbi:unnamed protein product [Adineta ricciae]|uniref:NmrA-like domain-containing protein n=1 Tax=Adineta ricciae TaxID=249248 RepID=A0A814XHB8_ADIRI|nr:unnamed protein product [Adineta ricciae]